MGWYRVGRWAACYIQAKCFDVSKPLGREDIGRGTNIGSCSVANSSVNHSDIRSASHSRCGHLSTLGF